MKRIVIGDLDTDPREFIDALLDGIERPPPPEGPDQAEPESVTPDRHLGDQEEKT